MVVSGVFTTAVFSISNAVVQESGEQTGLTGNTTTITGLNNLGDYTLPSRYGTTGTSKSIVITKTNYTPIINNVYASSSGIESVGGRVIIRTCPLNTTSLDGAYTTVSDIGRSYYIVTGLHFHHVLFQGCAVLQHNGRNNSSVASVSTDQPERGYKLMKHDKFNSTIPTSYGNIRTDIVSSSSGQYIFTIIGQSWNYYVVGLRFHMDNASDSSYCKSWQL
jgi:hypothetical protein